LADVKKRKSAGVETWVCDQCEVRASWLPGSEGGMPSGWGREDGDLLCLGCRRARAGELAVEAAASDKAEPVTRARTAGMIRFEIERDPERSNSVIARVCRTSVPAVTRVRGDLQSPEKAA
jgi:hypothetical protein